VVHPTPPNPVAKRVVATLDRCHPNLVVHLHKQLTLKEVRQSLGKDGDYYTHNYAKDFQLASKNLPDQIFESIRENWWGDYWSTSFE
jgi:hypothetical protein